MTLLAVAFPILPGKTAEWKAFLAELNGPRCEEFSESRRRAGVREYLVWRTLDAQFDWFVLDHDEYRLNSPDPQRVLHSPHFPGLALSVDALLAHDSARVVDVLQTNLQDPAHAAFVAQLDTTLKGQHPL